MFWITKVSDAKMRSISPCMPVLIVKQNKTKDDSESWLCLNRVLNIALRKYHGCWTH